MTTVITVGYQDRTVDGVVATLRSAEVKVLVDLRLTPLSRKAGLSKNGLLARLRQAGIDYVHLPQLGNPRDNRDAFRRHEHAAVVRYRAALKTPEGQAALEQLHGLATQHRVALMCFERDAAECHRSMVADALGEIGPVQTIHL